MKVKPLLSSSLMRLTSELKENLKELNRYISSEFRHIKDEAKVLIEDDDAEDTSAEILVLSDVRVPSIATIAPLIGALGGVTIILSSLPELLERRERARVKKLQALSNIGWGIQALSSLASRMLSASLASGIAVAFGVLGSSLQIAAGAMKLISSKKMKEIERLKPLSSTVLRDGALDIIGGTGWLLATLGIMPPITGGIFISSMVMKELITGRGTLGKVRRTLERLKERLLRGDHETLKGEGTLSTKRTTT